MSTGDDIEQYQAACRRVGDMIAAFMRSTGKVPTKVRIPVAEKAMLERGLLACFGKRTPIADTKEQFAGLDLEFHEGNGWSVTR